MNKGRTVAQLEEGMERSVHSNLEGSNGFRTSNPTPLEVAEQSPSLRILLHHCGPLPVSLLLEVSMASRRVSRS